VCASRLFLSRPASRLFPEPCPSTCRACSQISLLFSISRLQRSRQKRAPVLIFFLILRCNVFFLSCPYSPKTVNFVTPVLGVQSILSSNRKNKRLLTHFCLYFIIYLLFLRYTMKKSLSVCQSCLYHDELTTDRQLVICKFQHMKPGGVNPEHGYAISTGTGG